MTHHHITCLSCLSFAGFPKRTKRCGGPKESYYVTGRVFCIEQRLNAKPRIVQEDRRIWKMEELYEQQKIH
jgi:hypothetical protein